mmetsp:Transcript_22918/g.54050  ORF Transcript_22918/g.54050 Transcript_22918/m.54050 type:complete len:237 (+) Transcript_22918:247-957(+)
MEAMEPPRESGAAPTAALDRPPWRSTDEGGGIPRLLDLLNEPGRKRERRGRAPAAGGGESGLSGPQIENGRARRPAGVEDLEGPEGVEEQDPESDQGPEEEAQRENDGQEEGVGREGGEGRGAPAQGAVGRGPGRQVRRGRTVAVRHGPLRRALGLELRVPERANQIARVRRVRLVRRRRGRLAQTRAEVSLPPHRGGGGTVRAGQVPAVSPPGHGHGRFLRGAAEEGRSAGEERD